MWTFKKKEKKVDQQPQDPQPPIMFIPKVMGFKLTNGEEILALVAKIDIKSKMILIDRPMVVVRNYASANSNNYVIIQPWLSLSASKDVLISTGNIVATYGVDETTVSLYERLWKVFVKGDRCMFSETRSEDDEDDDDFDEEGEEEELEGEIQISIAKKRIVH